MKKQRIINKRIIFTLFFFYEKSSLKKLEKTARIYDYIYKLLCRYIF